MVRSYCFETRARTAASRGRGAKPRRPRLPPSDECPPPRDAGVLDLNVAKRAECEARHTSKCFLRIRPPRPNVILCDAGVLTRYDLVGADLFSRPCNADRKRPSDPLPVLSAAVGSLGSASGLAWISLARKQ